MARLRLALLLAGLTASASAQTVAPDARFLERRRTPLSKPTPLALSIALSFDEDTWRAVEVSTAGAVVPAAELARLMNAGIYRLELVQMILMAREGGSSLEALVKRRAKGEPLRDIARGLSVDYDVLYDRALAKAEAVERRLKTLLRVEPLPPEGKR